MFSLQFGSQTPLRKAGSVVFFLLTCPRVGSAHRTASSARAPNSLGGSTHRTASSAPAPISLGAQPTTQPAVPLRPCHWGLSPPHSQQCLCDPVSFGGSELGANCCYTSKPNSPVWSLKLTNVIFGSYVTTDLSANWFTKWQCHLSGKPSNSNSWHLRYGYWLSISPPLDHELSDDLSQDLLIFLSILKAQQIFIGWNYNGVQGNHLPNLLHVWNNLQIGSLTHTLSVLLTVDLTH